MMNKFKNRMRGFTLIELLVVIAIIGLLASIVLVSLSSARRKARDSRRVGDLRSMQLAQELYADATPTVGYPVGTVAAGGLYSVTDAHNSFTANLAALQTGGYVGGLPTDPTNSAVGGTYRYGYVPGNGAAAWLNCVAANTPCLHYVLYGNLEETGNAANLNDIDSAPGAAGYFAGANGIDCAAPYCVGG